MTQNQHVILRFGELAARRSQRQERRCRRRGGNAFAEDVGLSIASDLFCSPAPAPRSARRTLTGIGATMRQGAICSTMFCPESWCANVLKTVFLKGNLPCCNWMFGHSGK
ncbi:MAG: hypothetical protein PHU07_09580 [Acidocella sp.]|nr:hypothetical protein [Acidocella sp.]